MSKNKTIILWGRKGCQHCNEVKVYLEEKGYTYSNVDIEGKDYLRDVLELKYGIRHVPVVEIGVDGVFEGIIEKDYKRLETLIKQHEITIGY
ncbi:glutaredoxin [Bacillus fengqiuensis]|nr:glutaredoxin [Bacillus fengqiuensis]